MDIQVLKDKLLASNHFSAIDPAVKAGITAVLPALGEHALRQLLIELPNASQSLSGQAYLRFVAEAGQALGEALQGRSQSLGKVLRNAVTSPDLEFGRMAIPFVEDVLRKYPSLSGDSGLSELQASVAPFLVAEFARLPDTLLAALISGPGLLTTIASRSDVVADVRRLYYIASPEYDEGVWGEKFLPLLQKNQEIIGERTIVGQQELAPTTENWLREYDAFSGKPGPQRQALDRLHFVQDNPNAKVLSKEDQQILLKLCELYDWFSDPYVTEAEVAEFEDVTPATSRPGLLHTEAPVPNTPERETPEDRVEAELESPNVQGVLVQTPLGVSKSGLEVSADAGAHAPEGPSHIPSEEKVIGPKATEVPPKAEPVKRPRPASVPPLAAPIMPKAGSSVSRATLLDMDAIKAEAEKKKQMVQADIDKKLSKLKG